MRAPDADAFVAALVERHATPLRRPEFLKAIRALSARYVEKRAALRDRPPLDSAGKRAAFAAYYAPLHLCTVAAIARAIGRDRSLMRLVDLGCGTGVGAAWALELPSPPVLQGIDRSGWAADEAAWTYRTLGLAGRAARGDLVRAADDLVLAATSTAGLKPRGYERTGVILAWSANELDARQRKALLTALLQLARDGASVLVVEPLSRRAVPWFDGWAEAALRAGGRHDEWRIDEPLPALLAELAEGAGLKQEELLARSLAINLP
jgi:hypothetical protein